MCEGGVGGGVGGKGARQGGKIAACEGGGRIVVSRGGGGRLEPDVVVEERGYGELVLVRVSVSFYKFYNI